MGRRRGSGDGSIFRRGDGRWCAALELPGETGGRHRRYFYGATRDEARTKLRAAIAQVGATGVLAPERLTVGQFAESWLAAQRIQVRPATWSRYRSLLGTHLLPKVGSVRLAALAPEDVETVMNGMVKAGSSPRTAHHLRAVARSMLNDAQFRGYVLRNSASLAKPPRVPGREIPEFSVALGRSILDAVRGDRLGALFATAVATGCRLGELRGLRWSDLDLDEGTLSVRQAASRDEHGRQMIAEPKTRQSRRTVDLPGFVTPILREHRRQQNEERLLAGRLWHDFDLVFPSATGAILDPGVATRQFQRLLAAAGLPKLRFHDTRHLAATLLIAHGVDVVTVSKILGHTNVSTTLNVYSHALERSRKAAAVTLDAALTGTA